MKKAFSALLLVLFSAQTVTAETPAAGLLLNSTPALRLAPETSPLDLPAEYLSFEKYIPAEEGILIHLQTVHGSYEVQKNLAGALRFIHDNYGIDVLLTEGSAVPLDASLLDFVPGESGFNAAVLDLLARDGYAKAPELFLSEFPGIAAEGIEDAALYRANLEAYAESASVRGDAETYLQKLKTALFSKASETLPGEARDLLRLQHKQHGETLPLDAWIEELARSAQSILAVDLRSPLYQFDWPMLTRWFALKRLAQKAQASDFKSEEKLLAALSPDAGEELALFLSPGTPAEALPGNLEFLSGRFLTALKQAGGENFPALLAAAEGRLLSNEIRIDALIREEELLTRTVLEKLALTSEGQQTAAWFEDCRLMEKALTLSLARNEWLSIRERRDFTPSRLLSAVSGSPENHDQADRAMEAARTFYRYALEREDAMDRAIGRVLIERRPSIAVLITGGFHTPSVEETAKRLGYGYLRANPRMREDHDKEIYGRTILQTLKTSTLETAPFAALNETGLEEHGVDAEKFKAILMRAALLAANGDKELLETLKAARSELRSGKETPSVSQEMKFAETVINHYPQDGPNDPSVEIEALLAVLYGGSVQYYQKRSHRAINGRSWEQLRAENLQGLNVLAQLSLHPRQRNRIDFLREAAIQRLEKLGFRPQMNVATVDGLPTLGDLLSDHSDFENPFLHTFLGTRRKTLKNRLSHAVEVGKLGNEAEHFIRSYEHVYQMRMQAPVLPRTDRPGTDAVPGIAPYGIRVQHNGVAGPFKGGVRFVHAWFLNSDKDFMKLFDQLTKAGLNLTELRYFLRKWIREETLALALGMSTKSVVNNLPYGGGKGTILMADVYEHEPGRFVIQDLSRHYQGNPVQLRNFITRAYSRDLFTSGFIGPYRDIPAPDVDSRAADMNIMADEILRQVFLNLNGREKKKLPEDLLVLLETAKQRSIHDISEPYFLQALRQYMAEKGAGLDESVLKFFRYAATFTSKTIPMGGSRFREEATGYGGIHALKEILALEVSSRGGGAAGLSDLLRRPEESYNEKRPLAGLTAKIMGFGNAGGWAVTQLLNEGARLTAISEGPFGIVRKKSGFTPADIEWLSSYKRDHQGFHGIDQTEESIAREIELIDEQSFLSLDADIYVLAAKENSVTAENMKKTAGRVFLEIANGAITQEGYDYLTERALVIPDSIANAGGVTVSYFEWVQNLWGESWEQPEVIRRLEKQMSAAIRSVDKIRAELSLALGRRVDWRTTADITMIRSILQIQSTGRRPRPPFPVPAEEKPFARSELRSEGAQTPLLTAENLGILPEPFIPLEPALDRERLLETASELLGPGVSARNPRTWPGASSVRSREDAAVPEARILRERLGLVEAEAYLIGKSFAVDYGALPVLRKIIESAPAAIIAPEEKDRAQLEEYNEKLALEGAEPFLIAGSAEEALRLLREARPAEAAGPVRYAGLLATGDLKLMEAAALKNQLVDWVVKTPGEFSQYLVQNHLDSIVQIFTAQQALQTAA